MKISPDPISPRDRRDVMKMPTGFKRWFTEFSYRLATDRYAFWGLLVLAGSLFIGALIKGHEVLWRSTASLGIALIVIGCIRGWIDAHSGEGLASRCKRHAKKH